MAEYSISSANLSAIEGSLSNINRNLNAMNNNLDVIDSKVGNVDNNVRVVYDEVSALARDFHDFVQLQIRANQKSNAQQRLIQIRQEMEKRLDIMMWLEELQQEFCRQTIWDLSEKVRLPMLQKI